MSKLNEMILEFRENIGQSIEGLALLMQMEPNEYEELEKDWIPPEKILKRLCSLFEWNYKDIKRIAENSPSKDQRPKKSKLNNNSFQNTTLENLSLPLFSKMIIQARNEAKQDELGISTLLGISVEQFKEIENGFLPPNEIIRKFCTLFGWNYKEIKNKINAQSIIHFDNIQILPDVKKTKSLVSVSKNQFKKNIKPPISLNELIQKARMDANQSIEGVSLLLQINTELYEQIESGDVNPDPDLLKRISSLFGWNYNEMIKREKTSNFGKLLPVITKLDLKETSFNLNRLRKTQQEIEEKWDKISKDQQETLLTQLEFLLGSMENLKKDN
tara:strand:- start:77 stop:1066 length:990 start_codon:yes stop_codon:yes gene_type:complete